MPSYNSRVQFARALCRAPHVHMRSTAQRLGDARVKVCACLSRGVLCHRQRTKSKDWLVVYGISSLIASQSIPETRHTRGDPLCESLTRPLAISPSVDVKNQSLLLAQAEFIAVKIFLVAVLLVELRAGCVCDVVRFAGPARSDPTSRWDHIRGRRFK